MIQESIIFTCDICGKKRKDNSGKLPENWSFFGRPDAYLGAKIGFAGIGNFMVICDKHFYEVGKFLRELKMTNRKGG